MDATAKRISTPVSEDILTIEDVFAARRRLFIGRHYAGIETSDEGALEYAEVDNLVRFGTSDLSLQLGHKTMLAIETPTQGRSFKWRGAANMMLALLENGVRNFSPVAASAGNHAQGFALIMRYLGKKGVLEQLQIGKARIYLPEGTPLVKIEAIRRLGGEYVDVIQEGRIFDEANLAANRLVDENPEQFTLIPPFNDPLVMAGQGTIALEIIEQLLGLQPDPLLTEEELHQLVAESNFLKNRPLDIYVPIGGGGLIAGVSTVFKTFLPHAKIIGVEPSYSPSAIKSLRAGKLVPLDEDPPTVDESGVPLASGVNVKQIGDKTLRVMLRDNVSVVTVNDEQIKYVVNIFAQAEESESRGGSRPVPEQSGVIAVAALLNESKLFPAILTGTPDDKQRLKIAIVSGANMDDSVRIAIEERFGHIENLADQIDDLIACFPTDRNLPFFHPQTQNRVAQ